VFIRPEVAKYLEPFEVGGSHVLSGRALLDPVNARLDQYGQLPKGSLQRMLARPDTFVGTVHGVRGIWQRVLLTKAARGRANRLGQAIVHHVRLLIRFGNPVQVNKRLNFHQRAIATVQSGFAAAFNSSLARAISTALK
jgi:hypothetical protein